MDAKTCITDDELSILHRQDTSYTAFLQFYKELIPITFTPCSLLNGNPNKALNTYIDGCIRTAVMQPTQYTKITISTKLLETPCHACRSLSDNAPVQPNKGIRLSNQKHQIHPLDARTTPKPPIPRTPSRRSGFPCPAPSSAARDSRSGHRPRLRPPGRGSLPGHGPSWHRSRRGFGSG